MTTEADDPSGARGGSLPGEGQRATVLAHLPNGMFRLRLPDDREVVAHAAKAFRMAFARLLPGDLVVVDVSPFDPDKARIRRLLKSQRQHEQPTPNQPNQRERP